MSQARRRRAQARAQRVERRARALAVLVLVAAIVVTVLSLTAFAGSSSPSTVVAPAAGLGPARPGAQVLATRGLLRLQLPIAERRVTAIGYHAGGDGALRLTPRGRQGNQGLFGRIRERLFGTDGARPLYYHLGGDSTSSLDVGAAPDTDVFSPVDGTVIAIGGYVLDGRRRGVRIDVEPTTAPSLVVSVTRLRADPVLTVGSPVVAGRSRLGAVLDLARVERQQLARYTQDAGNHVTIEVRPAASLLP